MARPSPTPVHVLRDLIAEGTLKAIRAHIKAHPGILEKHWFLHDAASEGRADVCNLLVDLGMDVNAGSTDSLGVVPLARASEHVAAAKALLARGALPDGTDVTPAPPLVSATNKGNLELVKLLVDAGADIHREHLGQPMTALGWAEYYQGHKPTDEVARYLRKLGAINPYNNRDPEVDEWDGVRGEMQIELIERVLQGRVHPVATERKVGRKKLTLRQSRFPAQDYLFRLVFSVDFVAAGAPCEVALALPRFWPNHRRALEKAQFRWPWDLLFALGASLSAGATLRHGDVLSRGDARFGGVDWQPGFDQWIAVRYAALAKKRKAVPAAGLDETLLLVPHLGPKPLVPGRAAKVVADRKAVTKWNKAAGKAGRNTLIVPLCYDAPWLGGDWV